MINTAYILETIRDIVIVIPIFLTILTISNFCRAYFAYKLGDDTPYDHGFVTLNPFAHVNVLNLAAFVIFLMPLIPLLGGKMAQLLLLSTFIAASCHLSYLAPISVYNFRNPKRGALIYAFAVSFGYLLLAFIAGIIIMLSFIKSLPVGVAVTLRTLSANLMHVALTWALIELLPIPPFHAGRSLITLLPEEQEHIGDFLTHYQMITVMLLFFCPVLSDWFFGTIKIMVTQIQWLFFMGMGWMLVGFDLLYKWLVTTISLLF
jgi:hypothetical protein